MLGRKKANTVSERETLPLEACLAKTHMAAGGPAPGRTVAEHCQIAGAIAQSLLERLFRVWPDGAEIFPENSILAPLSHDIGKICPTFQKKIYKNLGAASKWPQLVDIDEKLEKSWGKHAAVSLATLLDMGADENFAWAVGEHHGYNSFMCRPNGSELFGGALWAKSRRKLLASLKGSREFPVIDSLSKKLLVSGLTVLSDWIASGEIFSDPRHPWESLVNTALDEAGFVFKMPERDLSFEEIFAFSPNEYQKALSRAATDPGVYILEAPMGSGKTEGALFAAYQIIAQRKACGIYFALPTQLTSNKIHERVGKFLSKILPDARAPVLAHADAWLERCKIQLMGGEIRPGGQWFEQGRRAILAPFAVGTVDQALLAAMRVPWAGLRLFGLAGKVVILDEIHSYDAYTSAIVDNLITHLVTMGSTVIILSATLAQSRRDSLLKAAGAMPQQDVKTYPRLSAAKSGQTENIFSISEERSSRNAIRLVNSDEEAIEEILDRASNGQQTVWIENTVAMAQDIFRQLGARAAQTGVEVGLLHSRFTMRDRMAIEAYWTEILGKAGKYGEKFRKDCGRILVGTQILEQSLDIDADFMVSRFAPTDLVLQRMGRLWRHERPDRPHSTRREIYLLSPKLEEVLKRPEEAFIESGTSAIYSPYVLARSLEVWQGRREVILPDELGELIEFTHGVRDEKKGSPMARACEKERREVERKMGNALQNLSVLGAMLDEERANTRLVEMESVKVLLLRNLDLKTGVCKILTDEHLALQSDLSMAERRQGAAMLAAQIVRVPDQYAPKVASKAVQDLFKPYLYEARAGNLRLLLIDRAGRACDVNGMTVDNIGYNSRVGYFRV